MLSARASETTADLGTVLRQRAPWLARQTLRRIFRPVGCWRFAPFEQSVCRAAVSGRAAELPQRFVWLRWSFHELGPCACAARAPCQRVSIAHTSITAVPSRAAPLPRTRHGPAAGTCCMRGTQRGLTTSLKWTRNGRPPWPKLRYAVHFLSPGQGVLPLRAP